MPRPHPTSAALLVLAQPILSVLQKGPCGSGTIAEILEWSHTTANRRLLILEQAGSIKRFGGGRSAKWALASYDVPEPVCHVTPLAFGAKTREKVPPARQDGHRTTIPRSLAWWVGHPREGFTACAYRHYRDEMRHSKDHLRMQLRILQ